MPRYWACHSQPLSDLKSRHSLPKVDLVAGLQLRPARRAMHFLAHSVAHDPDAAVGCAALVPPVPSVVEQPVFARGLVVDNMRMFARYRTVDLGVFRKGQIVAADEAFGTVYIHGASDVHARLGKPDFRRVGLPC